MDSTEPVDQYGPLRLPSFRRFTIGRNLAGFGDQMQSVAIGWEVYGRTHDSLALGYVGLVQAAPIFLFALIAGHIADNYPRRLVACCAQFAFALCSLMLAQLSRIGAPTSWFYLLLFVAMTARALGNPARGALLPHVVPRTMLASAISWDSSIRRIAVMTGAAAGGWLLQYTGTARAAEAFPFLHTFHVLTSGRGSGIPAVVYLCNALLGVLSISAIMMLRVNETHHHRKEPVTLETLLSGIRYIRSTRIIYATITLDLIAVLFGGATSLLPQYASDILHASPRWLGLMRSSGSLGALVTAVIMAHIPAPRYPGRAMLTAVIGFGLVTIAFGLSRNMALTMVALALIGALDMVSVVVRQTLLQTLTPDAMRGRVNAINSIFVNSSNEIGGFESGLVSRLVGPVYSVVSGGIASIFVTLYAGAKWPALREFDSRAPQEPEGS